MATTFTYKVKDTQNKIVSGLLEADTQSAVAAKLRQMGYTVITIAEKTEAPTVKDLLRRFKFFQRVKSKDLAVFSRQFATMINAGLPITRCLSILAEQTNGDFLRKVILEVQKDVEGGQSLSVALSKHPKAFNNMFVSMVRAGEASGVLDQILLRIADHFQAEMELKGKIKSAMAYPVVMFAITILITFVMITFIVPIFAKMFKNLGGDLPFATKMLLNISGIMNSIFGVFIFAGIIGAIFGFRAFKKTNQGRYIWDSFKLKMPIFGQLISKIALARFSRTLGTLISSGNPILNSLDIVADSVGNAVIGKAVLEARSSIKEGESIANQLAKSGAFPPMVIQMINVGEETGALETMCSKVADFYEKEVANTVEALTSMIEPILIVFLGVVVGGILISLYLPMFQIVNMIK